MIDIDGKIRRSVGELERYIIREHYRGYDPFDALTSPLCRVPLIGSSRVFKLALQQGMKRMPMNIRPLLGIVKGRNPVTLGLCIEAFSWLTKVFPERKDLYASEIKSCLEMLVQSRSTGFSGACWGYDFPWEARQMSLPANYPTIVATGIITNALFVCHTITNNQQALDLCRDAVKFVMNDLNKTQFGESFCYSYSPQDRQCVLNATMKGARLLAQVYSITGERGLAEEAKRTVRFVADAQHENGSWPYAHRDPRTWVDNFHTGYILDCLDEYSRLTGDDQYTPVMKKGFAYYRANFFQPDGFPKYYDSKAYPLDPTAAAQSMLTLCRFNDTATATKVALLMIDSMQDQEGFFYYQRRPGRVNKVSFMRWSNAWMFAALSYILFMSGSK